MTSRETLTEDRRLLSDRCLRLAASQLYIYEIVAKSLFTCYTFPYSNLWHSISIYKSRQLSGSTKTVGKILQWRYVRAG